MAERKYKINNRSLFVDNGDGKGFQNKGNASSTANQALIKQIDSEGGEDPTKEQTIKLNIKFKIFVN